MILIISLHLLKNIIGRYIGFYVLNYSFLYLQEGQAIKTEKFNQKYTKLDIKIDNQLTIIFLTFKFFWVSIDSIVRTNIFESSNLYFTDIKLVSFFYFAFFTLEFNKCLENC